MKINSGEDIHYNERELVIKNLTSSLTRRTKKF